MSAQTAVKVTSPEMSIFSPIGFNSVLSPTFQPANSLPSIALNVGFGSLYSLPFVTVLGFIDPSAPASVLKVTLNSIGFQIALISVSPLIFMLSLGCFKFVSSPIFQPENSWLSFGGVKVFAAGRVYVSSFFLVTSILVPVPPFGTTVTL